MPFVGASRTADPIFPLFGRDDQCRVTVCLQNPPDPPPGDVVTGEFQVKKYQVFVQGELVTPYEGWRKAYEMPCGLILAPVSLCSQLLSVFSFGIYPFSFSSGIQDLAFTGLNPCLNWESESRTERRVLSSEDKLIDEFQEDKGTPLPNVAVSVVSGEMSKNYITDKFGIFHLTLVGLNAKDSVFNMAREFDFQVGDDKRMTWAVEYCFSGIARRQLYEEINRSHVRTIVASRYSFFYRVFG